MDVTTAQGVVRGRASEHGWSFKGIPYAAAPAGPLRFAAPAPAPHHDGVLDAGEWGATVSTPPQRSAVIDELLPDPVRPGSNGLNLNIWTPDVTGRAPVFVFLHGGGFATGAGSTTAFDGTSFARDGVVAVTINYRLAVEGFAYLQDAPPNRGLLDQIAALQWVRDNIAAFGGDPDQVTLAGESAGAMAVCTLLAVPRADGLFRRAISESGTGHHVHTPARAALVAAELAAELDTEPTAAALAEVPVDVLHAATNAVITRMTAGTDPRFAEFRRLVFQPVIDGDVLSEHPVDAAARGVGSQIELLIGWNAAEYGLFCAPSGLYDAMTEDLLTATTARLVPDPAALIGAYRTQFPEAGPAELWIQLQSDWFCSAPTDRFIETRAAGGGDSFVYEFAWRPSTFDGRIGACHTLELPFVFDTLADPWGRAVRGADAPQSLADEVHAAWCAFVSTGDPGWPAYGDGRNVRRLDVASSLVHDPAAFRRQAWESVAL